MCIHYFFLWGGGGRRDIASWLSYHSVEGMSHEIFLFSLFLTKPLLLDPLFTRNNIFFYDDEIIEITCDTRVKQTQFTKIFSVYNHLKKEVKFCFAYQSLT